MTSPFGFYLLKNLIASSVRAMRWVFRTQSHISHVALGKSLSIICAATSTLSPISLGISFPA
jgi:hypothetical protein